MSVVLITGVSRFLGGRLAAQLAADPSVERVIGVDAVPPRADDLARLGRTEFVRADIRNPLLAKVIAQAGVSTVVHASVTASARSVGGRVALQEMNVIGTMQLLSACQKSETVERVVLKSTAAVYGSGPGYPAVLTEADHPGSGSGRVTVSGAAKDAVEVEGYVRGFGRRRPDTEVSVLRFGALVGPGVDSAFTRYLSMPLVPTPLGYDARMQFVHESDAVEALRLATVTSRPGVVNVAADGVLPLSQVLRRVGAVRIPVPAPAFGAVGGAVRDHLGVDVTAEDARYLTYGRVLSTTTLHERFGFRPRFTTAQAVADMLPPRRSGIRLARAAVGVGSRMLTERG